MTYMMLPALWPIQSRRLALQNSVLLKRKERKGRRQRDQEIASMAGYIDSDDLPEPWIQTEKGFYNPVTGQLFKTKEDLYRYLAYAERSKVPRECKLGTRNGECSLPKGNASLKIGPKSRLKKRTRSPFASLVMSETKARRRSDDYRESKIKRKRIPDDEKGKNIIEVESDDEGQVETDNECLFILEDFVLRMSIMLHSEHCPRCGKIGCICYDAET